METENQPAVVAQVVSVAPNVYQARDLVRDLRQGKFKGVVAMVTFAENDDHFVEVSKQSAIRSLTKLRKSTEIDASVQDGVLYIG